MEKQEVYDFAEKGSIIKLKLILAGKNERVIGYLINALTNGTSPLIIACIKGHEDYVEYIIKHCSADVEQAGSAIFKQEVYESKKPIFFASIAGQYDIVKLLIGEFNASIECLTHNADKRVTTAIDLINTGFDVDFEDAHKNTRLVVSCTEGNFELSSYYMTKNVNVNKGNCYGKTALHLCAQYGHIKIAEKLLTYGAKNLRDHFNNTPLEVAVLADHYNIVNLFVTYRMETPFLNTQEKLAAFEYLGIEYVDKECFQLGREFFRKAIELRLDASLIDNALNNLNLLLSHYVHENEAYTVERLTAMNDDQLRINSLLIKERRFGSVHLSVISSIKRTGLKYYASRHYERAMQLWMYMLDYQQQERPFKEYFPHLLNIVDLLHSMNNDSYTQFSKAAFKHTLRVFKNVLRALKSVVEQEQIIDTDQFDDTLTVVLHILYLLSICQKSLNADEKCRLKHATSLLIQMNLKTSTGSSFMHLASMSHSNTIKQLPLFLFPSIDVLRLLLENGSSAEEQDAKGNTPLHLAGIQKPFKKSICSLLLSQGVQLDLKNDEGKTPRQIIKIASASM